LPEITIDSKWELKFIQGGPELPQPVVLNRLTSWTTLGQTYADFSGIAEYTTQFSMNIEEKKGYLLDLGDVRESAQIVINGQDAGTLFAQPYSIDITPFVMQGNNQISIKVTNLPANRLSALERSGYEWKKFYEINMVNIHYKPFDAAVWEPSPSGLIGEVKIVPVSYNQ